MGTVDIAGNLRYLLNQWDPIGVAELVDDEYDGLIAPLLTRLGAGAGRAEISEFLWHELEDHFGMSPYHHREHYGVDPLADRLVAWWAVVNSA
ncbi:hypothetical protein ABZ942_38240 [Nocardia sp. NPDC046473]|uniref:hypothetical protein n=1 Tax=Nocardia sp. NPDC046473 TaxID=3155733 RepID=UPI00340F4B4D